MIQGLKARLDSDELADLCRKEANRQLTQADAYARQKEVVANAAAELQADLNLSSMSNNPKRMLADKEKACRLKAAELTFLADHIAEDEQYELAREDLIQLGIAHHHYDDGF
jgi:hypothetical protein